MAEEVHTKAAACHSALEDGKIRQALNNAEKALSLNEELRERAREYNVKINYGFGSMKQPNDNSIWDPLVNYSDLEEVVILSEVMLGKKSLAQAIEENRSFAKKEGVIAFLTGNVKYMNSNFVYLGDAFQAHKSCVKEVSAAFKEGVIEKSAEEFCN